jgi:hypothetical protein
VPLDRAGSIVQGRSVSRSQGDLTQLWTTSGETGLPSRRCSDMRGSFQRAGRAINCLMAVVLEDDIRTRVIDPLQELDTAHALAAEQLIEVVQCYLKQIIRDRCGIGIWGVLCASPQISAPRSARP